MTRMLVLIACLLLAGGCRMQPQVNRSVVQVEAHLLPEQDQPEVVVFWRWDLVR